MERQPQNDSGPLTKQIAASLEDVKALLDSNHSMSCALLARMIRDNEEANRKRFRAIEAKLASLVAADEKTDQRLALAGTKFKELREELDVLKEKSRFPANSGKPSPLKDGEN